MRCFKTLSKECSIPYQTLITLPRQFPIWLVLIGLLSGCRDSSVQPAPVQNAPRKTGLVGTWNWLEQKGGFADRTITPATCGCTRKLIFASDSSFQSYYGDSLVLSGTFRVYTHILSPRDTLRELFYLTAANGHPRYYGDELGYPVRDTLSLGTIAYDGILLRYERAK